MTENDLFSNAGDATRRSLENILDWEYHILNDEEELTGNFLLESPDFKDFATGFTELLFSKGYSGDKDDNKAKYKFFHNKCKENNIELTPSVVKSWFEDTRPVSSAKSRENVYKLCFALNCTLEETTVFFTRVYFECPFNFRSWQEAVYYYCFKNSLGYCRACELQKQAEEIFEDAESDSSSLLYTHTKKIGDAVHNITSDTELLSYFSQHRAEFLAANKTAYDHAERLIQENTELAARIYESEYSYQTESMRRIKQVKNTDLFLLVLFDFDMHTENKERSFSKESDFPEVISSNFISKENISRILSRKKVSYDTLRKNLMILEFFNYFANLKIEKEEAGETFFCSDEDFSLFLDEISDMLNECGYPPLYARNPFDWLIMHCANTFDEPLKEFKNAVQAYYLK